MWLPVPNQSTPVSPNAAAVSGEAPGIPVVEMTTARDHEPGGPGLARRAGADGDRADAGELRAGEHRRQPALARTGHRADGVVLERDPQRAVQRIVGRAGLVDLRLVEGGEARRRKRREDRRPRALRQLLDDVADAHAINLPREPTGVDPRGAARLEGSTNAAPPRASPARRRLA